MVFATRFNTLDNLAIGLLIAFRLWRLVRVMHVTTEMLDLQHESEVGHLKAQIESLQDKLDKALAQNRQHV